MFKIGEDLKTAINIAFAGIFFMILRDLHPKDLFDSVIFVTVFVILLITVKDALTHFKRYLAE